MSTGIIENAEELKNLYLQTDITDVAAVQSAVKDISENVYVAGKDKYLEALNSATPANLSKARKYNKMVYAAGIKSTILKHLGWIVMAIFGILMAVVDSDYEDSITTWLSLGFWIGVVIQIYIAVLKSAWSKLTLSGAVIHSALKSTSALTTRISTPIKTQTEQVKPVANDATAKYVFCSECGRKNKEGAQFCENCGTKL